MNKIKEELRVYKNLCKKGEGKYIKCQEDRVIETFKESLAQQKEEIKKVVKKDLDNGMFNKICSSETTFMDYLSNLLEKL